MSKKPMESKDKDQVKKRSLWLKALEYLRDWSTVILAVLAIRAFGVESMIVPTGSMEQTIFPGDAVLVNKFRYGFKAPFTNADIVPGRTPHRGEIIVFRYPRHSRFPQPEERYALLFPLWCPLLPFQWDRQEQKLHYYAPENWVKRCVGLPGDTVEIVAKKLYVNGKRFPYDSKAVHQDLSIFPCLVPREEFERRWMDLLCLQYSDSLFYADSVVYRSYPRFGKVTFAELRHYYDSLLVTAYYSDRISKDMLTHYIVNFYMNKDHLRRLERNRMPFDLPLPPQGSTDLAGFYDAYYQGTTYGGRPEIDSMLYASYIMHFYMRDNFGPIVVPRGTVMAMGDNRDLSQDCRYWGFVPIEMLKGSPLVVYYSLGDEFEADSSKRSIPERILFTHWERIGKPVKWLYL